MSASIATMLARYDAAEDARKERGSRPRLGNLPSILPEVGYPLTVYRPSAVHDAWHVVYESKGSPRSARSSWAVPETWEDGR